MPLLISQTNFFFSLVVFSPLHFLHLQTTMTVRSAKTREFKTGQEHALVDVANLEALPKADWALSPRLSHESSSELRGKSQKGQNVRTLLSKNQKTLTSRLTMMDP